jgi:hypothetical protein
VFARIWPSFGSLWFSSPSSTRLCSESGGVEHEQGWSSNFPSGSALRRRPTSHDRPPDSHWARHSACIVLYSARLARAQKSLRQLRTPSGACSHRQACSRPSSRVRAARHTITARHRLPRAAGAASGRLKSRNTVFQLSARSIAVLDCEPLLHAVGPSTDEHQLKKRSFELEVKMHPPTHT